MRPSSLWAGVRAAAAASLLLPAFPDTAAALDAKRLVEERCSACHDLAGPAPTSFAALLARKAPDLFYAGSKFKRPWLETWLQQPTPIRPAGVMFLNHVKIDKGRDVIDKATLTSCAARLSASEAKDAALYLATLVDPKMATGVVDPATKVSRPKALRLFRKQLPCIGCHTIKAGKRRLGGVSGPDLSQAGRRLQADWIYARIENPQYWDPMTWMPKIQMSHKKRELLTMFIASMK